MVKLEKAEQNREEKREEKPPFFITHQFTSLVLHQLCL